MTDARRRPGDYGCVPYEQEGPLLAVLGRALDEELKEIFVGELKGAGTCGQTWPPGLLDRLRSAVALPVHGSGNRDELLPTPLVLDESRLAEADEAWLPVLTPAGPGFLTWENSD
ncbi:DUF6210 family protein [Streptomyces sp. NPDC048420]|uniref:DUF6210 family protein n=1 Tax=Streptomyces sp. NPDC048420 TaxID=3155755 RepID=UPI00341DBB7E